MRHLVLFISILLGALCFPHMIQAGGFQLYLMGHRQLGMGLAATGQALDASAGYFNPGALSFVPRRANILFGGAAVRPLTSFRPVNRQDTLVRVDTVILSPIYLHSSWQAPKRGRLAGLALGLSITNPYSVTTRWPDDWAGKLISQEFTISTLHIQGTLSYRLHERLGLGFGLIYAAGNLLSRRALAVDGPNDSEGTAQFTGTGAGLGFSAGIYLKPSSNTALGLTYRHHIDLPIDSGRASFSVPSSLQDQYPAQAFYTLVPLPKEINLGFSYQPQEQLLLSFEVQWVGWSRLDSLTYAFPETIRNLPLYPERAYRNTFTVRVGGEYRSSERVQIRAGAYYDASPIPRLRLSPELPDATAIGLSTGLGLRLIGGLSLDASLVYEYTGDRTDSFSAAAFSGVYRSTQLSFGLGLGYQF